MSFAKDTKLQILNIELTTTESELAFLSGLLHASGEFDIANKTISFLTDIEELYRFVNNIISKLYGENTKAEIADDIKINKTKYYRITLPQKFSTIMMQDFGLMNQSGEFFLHNIDENILKDDESKKSFIKGVFLGCGTSSIRLSKNTETTNTGYNLEFVSHSHDFLLEFSKLLAEFEIIPRLVQRKNHYVLYLKESSQICDLLAIISAYESVLKLQNELALRELRNKINRQTNCVSANITKTVNASMKQVKAIEKISNTIGLESLSMDLQEIALLRLANPEESLTELLKLCSFPVTKSGLNHRMTKILKIAQTL